MPENGIPNIDYTVDAAEVVVTPVDPTLTIEGEAADAKAVGDALALKADVSQLRYAVTVNEQAADADRNIAITAGNIPNGDNTVAGDIEDLEAEIALKLDIANVANTLDVDDEGYALDARQGAALNEAIQTVSEAAAQLSDAKIDKMSISNVLNVTAEGYVLDARQGAVLKELIDALTDATASKLTSADIVDNLTTSTTGKALDANQGRVLKGLIDALPSVANNLTTDTAGYALDARQGAVLKALIDALTVTANSKLNAADVISNLDTSVEGKALDATQGRELKQQIDGLVTAVSTKLTAADIVDALTSAASNKALSAQQGAVLKGLIDDLTVLLNDKLAAADLINDLDTTTAGKALDARQGRALRLLVEQKLGVDAIVDDLDTTTTTEALSARQGNVLSQMGQQLLALVQQRVTDDDIANNLTTDREGLVLDARQGKALDERLSTRETELDNTVMHFDDLVINPDATSGGKPLDAGAIVGLDTEIGLKLDKQNVLNSLEVTSAGYALDARAGKTINDKIDNLIDMTIFGSYASVDDAVADIWDSMSNGSFRMGRVAIEGVATFMFMAYRHGGSYATALLFSYGGDLRQYNKVNGTISGYRFTHQ